MYKYEGDITNEVILDFISKYEKDTKQRYKKLQDYYIGNNAILTRTMIQGNDINNKIANNYAGYITDIATGYFLGKPVNYSDVGQNKLLDVIQDIYNYNDEQDENVDISKECSIKGRCYILMKQTWMKITIQNLDLIKLMLKTYFVFMIIILVLRYILL